MRKISGEQRGCKEQFVIGASLCTIEGSQKRHTKLTLGRPCLIPSLPTALANDMPANFGQICTVHRLGPGAAEITWRRVLVRRI